MAGFRTTPEFLRHATKWFLTALFLVFTVLFLFSLSGWFYWQIRNTFSCGLERGSIYFSEWDPAAFAAISDMPKPGWGAWFNFGYGVPAEWIPHLEITREATTYLLPVWIPALVVGAVAAMLWWQQRQATAGFLRAVRARLRPASPLRPRIWAVLTATVGVFVFGLVLEQVLRLMPILMDPTGTGPVVVSWLRTWVAGSLLFGAPLFGYGIVWLWVEFRNRLTVPRLHLCRHCGYNLTGNVSGTCPECGAAWNAGPADEAPTI